MIRSTFAGFNMAQMAMSANQRALDVTGQNLSNMNTPGYTRQRLDLASISTVGASMSSSPFDNKVGQGVMMTGISQVRDPFLDKQFRSQIVKVGTADAMDQIIDRIGDIFDETDKDAISTDFNKLISQLQKMGTTTGADQASSDATIRSACEVLLNAVHQNSSDLKALEEEIVDKLKNSIVPNVNKCIDRIAELNQSIKNSQILGNPSLELQDERNAMIDDLASYLPIKVNYKSQELGGGVKIDIMDITFTTPGGDEYSLVADTKGADFDIKDTNGGLPLVLNIKDTNGKVNAADLSNSLGNGVLKGNFDMLNKSETFDNSDVKGIGYYGKMFNAFVNQFATMMNDMNTVKDASGAIIKGGPLFQTTDGSTDFTAGNIKISEGWKDGSVSILCSKEVDAPSTDYTNIHNMIKELSGNKGIEFKDPTGKVVYTGTLLDCYSGIQATQAIEGNSSGSILKNNLTVLNKILDAKDSVSGVYMDEEVMNMMRYQQSYNAAARLMTTLDEALNTLINSTGVVGR